MNSETLVSASIQGGILAAIVWFVVRMMPSMPPKAKVWLWRLVFIKFALGFVGIANVPLPVLPAHTPAIASTPAMSQPAAATSVDVSGRFDDVIERQAVPASALGPGNQSGGAQTAMARTAIRFAWLVGLVVLCGLALFNVVRTARLVRRATLVEDSWVNEELEALVRQEGIRTAPRLLESPEVKTAMLAWGLRPSIVLPAGVVWPRTLGSRTSSPLGASTVAPRRTRGARSRGAGEDLRLMLAHEVAHLANRDLLWNLLASVVKGIFFFHPLVWLAAWRAHVAQESAADQRAVRMTGSSLKAYGEMLLRATVAGDALRAMPGAVAVAGSIRALRERLDAMGRFAEKPPMVLRWGAFAAIATMLPGYCLVAQTAPTPPTPEVSVQVGPRHAPLPPTPARNQLAPRAPEQTWVRIRRRKGKHWRWVTVRATRSGGWTIIPPGGIKGEGGWIVIPRDERKSPSEPIVRGRYIRPRAQPQAMSGPGIPMPAQKDGIPRAPLDVTLPARPRASHAKSGDLPPAQKGDMPGAPLDIALPAPPRASHPMSGSNGGPLDILRPPVPAAPRVVPGGGRRSEPARPGRVGSGTSRGGSLADERSAPAHASTLQGSPATASQKAQVLRPRGSIRAAGNMPPMLTSAAGVTRPTPTPPSHKGQAHNSDPAGGAPSTISGSGGLPPQPGQANPLSGMPVGLSQTQILHSDHLIPTRASGQSTVFYTVQFAPAEVRTDNGQSSTSGYSRSQPGRPSTNLVYGFINETRGDTPVVLQSTGKGDSKTKQVLRVGGPAVYQIVVDGRLDQRKRAADQGSRDVTFGDNPSRTYWYQAAKGQSRFAPDAAIGGKSQSPAPKGGVGFAPDTAAGAQSQYNAPVGGLRFGTAGGTKSPYKAQKGGVRFTSDTAAGAKSPYSAPKGGVRLGPAGGTKSL